MLTISKSELKNHMLEIFKKIEKNGEELIITEHNLPVLKIVPIKEKATVDVLFKEYQGKIIFHEDINATTEDEWEII